MVPTRLKTSPHIERTAETSTRHRTRKDYRYHRETCVSDPTYQTAVVWSGLHTVTHRSLTYLPIRRLGRLSRVRYIGLSQRVPQFLCGVRFLVSWNRVPDGTESLACVQSSPFPSMRHGVKGVGMFHLYCRGRSVHLTQLNHNR